MKKLDKNKITALLFCCIVTFGIMGYFSWGGFIKPLAHTLVYGFSEYYSEGNSVSDSLKNVIGEVETLAGDFVGLREEYIGIYSRVQKDLGFKVIKVGDDNLVKLNNGYLAFDYRGADEETIKNDVESLVSLKDNLDKSNTPLLFYLTPNKTQPGNSQMPNGLPDDLNTSADRFLELLGETSVEHVDFRKEIVDNGFDYYSCFYKTDHHWTSKTGFWAFTQIYERLSEICEFDYDEKITDINNYNVKTYKDIISPKFETSFEVLQPLKPDFDRKTGNFTDTLLRMDFVETKDLYHLNPYVTYNGGDFAFQAVKNNLASNDKKILIVRDSYANTVTPFLASGVSEMYIFDMRESVTHYKIDSLNAYIDEIKPDAVVFLYSPLRLLNNSGEFDFN